MEACSSEACRLSDGAYLSPGEQKSPTHHWVWFKQKHTQGRKAQEQHVFDIL
jgi:hypothetical protein